MAKRLKVSSKGLNVGYRIDVNIDANQCKGCGICVAVCPWNVLAMGNELSEKGYRIIKIAEPERCIGCGRCVALCPDFAIVVEVERMHETG